MPVSKWPVFPTQEKTQVGVWGKQLQSPKEASRRELSGAPQFGKRGACVTAQLLPPALGRL